MSPTGRQAERTSLAWSRTALALLAEAALLLARDSFARPLGPVLAGIALALAAATALVARRRVHALLGAPGTALAARTEVMVLGSAVAALGVAVGVGVLLS